MRDKNLFHLLLLLNLGLAGAFLAYLLISSSRHPSVSSANFPVPQPSVSSSAPSVSDALQGTNPPPAVVPPKTAEIAPPTSVPTNLPPAEPVFTTKKFGWKDVETEAYQGYLDSLRAVGCPDDKIRTIILADIEDLINQKRLQEAVANDLQWWRAEPEPTVASLLRDKGMTLDDQRRNLISKWLGEELAEKTTHDDPYWSAVQLTGPVLGALSKEDHNTVQEICSESMDRYQGVFWSAINAGQALNQVELAKLRQHTRSELVKVLNADELDEFLLRYSHNANKLRKELHGMNPTPEEFRKIFKATDAMDHALQLEYGGTEALSPQQRERFEQRRTEAIRQVLSPERFEAYHLTQDPIYRQAQMMALQYGAPPAAVMEIYQMTRANETRRQQIMADASLTPEQKRRAVNAVYLEQQQTVRKIVSQTSGQPQATP